MTNPLTRRVATLEATVQQQDAPLQVVLVDEFEGETVEKAMLAKFGTPQAPPGANVVVIITGVARDPDGPAGAASPGEAAQEVTT